MTTKILIHELSLMLENLVLILNNARQISRPNAIGTSASGYNDSRGGTNDEGDNIGNDGGDVGQQQQSQYPMSSFTCEEDFMYCT
ncbi:hypothetical protein CK203_084387 [Vitis vinifera]|uniref:Uncharacterized protein n=1 Tax=Vitis vinifera TaxID=29760 RepID=A0A438EN11_VITVI|nr:hypothetical protein CK203_084387 [Vitis vinifera]